MIAAPITAIDDLIENNRRRIEVLEEIARAIYREWFVHFRFRGHEAATFADSTLGPIPDGWEVRNLFDAAEVAFGFSFKSKQFSETGEFPVVRIRDVASGATSTFTDEDPGGRYEIRDGDVLVGMDGEFHIRQWTSGTAWLNQRVARLRPLTGLSALHLRLAIVEPIQRWNKSIVGTTVAHLGKRHMEQIELIVPAGSLAKQSAEVFDGIADEILTLDKLTKRVTSIRDLLLPKLVTGEVDVSSLDLDALVGAAG